MRSNKLCQWLALKRWRVQLTRKENRKAREISFPRTRWNFRNRYNPTLETLPIANRYYWLRTECLLWFPRSFDQEDRSFCLGKRVALHLYHFWHLDLVHTLYVRLLNRASKACPALPISDGIIKLSRWGVHGWAPKWYPRAIPGIFARKGCFEESRERHLRVQTPSICEGKSRCPDWAYSERNCSYWCGVLCWMSDKNTPSSHCTGLGDRRWSSHGGKG